MEMNKEGPFQPKYAEELDDIALRAAQVPEFAELVKNSKNRIETIRAIREKLRAFFPEISELPEPKQGEAQMPIGGLASNEFMIARKILELLGG
jgi:hypothetical protein